MTEPVIELSDESRRAAILGFDQHFGGRPEFVVRSPGRVNLIGDHTDYNEGFVLPMAIDRHVWLAGRMRRDRRVVVRSRDYEAIAIDLDDIQPLDIAWGQYVAGVAWSLSMGNRALRGWEGFIASDVPAGAGLSSSAALELAVARAFAEVSALPWNATEMALAAQRAENDWVGMSCGIMDQLVVAASEDGALLIDCRSLETLPVSVPPGWSVVVIDSGTRRSLVDSAYNERRAACESAAHTLGIASLRDATLDAVLAADLPDVVRRRARHVVNENMRVRAAAAAMSAGDALRMGELMVESHRSLRDDYEVSTPALDLLVDTLLVIDGVAGARMTGAGFGGCVVALVEATGVDAVVRETLGHARAAGLDDAAAHVTRPVAGTSAESID